MKTIKVLQDAAVELSNQYAVGSITPQSVGGLLKDSFDYIEGMEQNLQNIGIRKTYNTVEEMYSDENPVDLRNIPIRFGQLVSIYSDAEVEHNNEVYAYCNPGWQLVGRIGDKETARVEDDVLIIY